MWRKHSRLSAALLISVALPCSVPAARAQELVLRVHQQLPAHASIPKNFIVPWAKKVEAESNARLKVEHYGSMQLGGTPPQIYDQIKDGVIDIGWTLPGYTPGRFPKSEVFELPFLATTGELTSQAAWEFYLKHLQDEYKDVKVVAIHTNGPYLIHAKGNGVRKLEDMKGLRIRNATRVINKLIATLGATAIGMPVPQVPESLAMGVIDGATMPWEVTAPLRISELVNTHTNFSGTRSLTVGMFVFAMNKARYESLPDDLRQVIDQNSGLGVAKWAGRVMDEGDVPGFAAAKGRGNALITLDVAETARWKKAAEPVTQAWIAEMNEKGFAGKQLVDDARALVAKYSGPEG